MLNSHQSWEEAGQGLGGGDLLTVVTNPLNPDPRILSWGGRESEKEKYKG